jgi:hypothetical protein
VTEKPTPETHVPKLSWWLTHDEFQLVWAFQWVAYHWRCYGRDDMPDEAAEEIFGSYGRAMRWALAKLCCEYGVSFVGLSVNENGEVFLKQEKPVEPRNQFFIYRIASGKQPDPRAALQKALALIRERRWTIPTEPMRQALDEVERSYAEARSAIDPETDQLAGKAIDHAMRQAGYIRSDDEAN